MKLLHSLKSQFQELTSTKLKPASESLAQTYFNESSLAKVEKKELESIITLIADAVYARITQTYLPLNTHLDYTNIERVLTDQGYKIHSHKTPSPYWIISWLDTTPTK